MLEQLQTQLDKISEEYCEIETSEKLESIQQDIQQINERIEETEVGLKILLGSLKGNENTNTALNDDGKAKIRFSEIPLPEFSGKIAEIANFKNQFTNSISNNDQLNDSQKLHYLRTSLKGEAELLESSSDNFQSLFKALSDRYENQPQLIDSHVFEIINHDKIRSESATELRALMDCVNKHIRALWVLRYKRNKLSDGMLINIILQKIDREPRKQFEFTLKTADIPTFDILMKFLEMRQRIVWKTAADAPVKVYTLSTVTYETVYAPFLATRTSKALADEEGKDFPKAADVICSDIYMDDILSGEVTIEDAKKLQAQICELFLRAGFELHKWASNSPNLLKDISTSSYSFNKGQDVGPVKNIRYALGSEG
ncbi:hypothetical protein AVEN_4184-1 [Araneus ventricosus]|uniref:Reverse transcriptase domain-containing protein n=1 Tax=Araneus ventricosus TaxID=182803 RepID=A0A4Y2W9B2_ARAVE|nr:hypothetical protein AVEN_4184-1 [Araneus ventricosus]